jgi:hypothetical protein
MFRAIVGHGTLEKLLHGGHIPDSADHELADLFCLSSTDRSFVCSVILASEPDQPKISGPITGED